MQLSVRGYIRYYPEGSKHGYGTYRGEYLGERFNVETRSKPVTAKQVRLENPKLIPEGGEYAVAEVIRKYENLRWKYEAETKYTIVEAMTQSRSKFLLVDIG